MGRADLRASLAGKVRAWRKAAGVSQDEFAVRCGLHRTYIGSVERQERNVTLTTLELLSRGTGLTVPALLSKGGAKR